MATPLYVPPDPVTQPAPGAALLATYASASIADRRAFWKHLAMSGDQIDEPRFDWADVRRTMQAVRNAGNDRVVLITDLDTSELPSDVRAEAAEVLRQVPAGHAPGAFVVALESDRALVDALARVDAIPGSTYHPVLSFHPTARWFHRDETARAVLRDEAAHAEGKFSLDDFETLMQALDATRRIDGAYVEVGVYRGRSARAALRYMREAGIERDAFLLDTFDGFAYADAHASGDAMWRGTHGDTSIELVRDQLAGLEPFELLRCDVTTDPLPPGTEAIALANIDVDMREAVAAALAAIAPRVAIGGMIVLEDPGHTPALGGALLALHEFLATPRALDFTPIHMRSGQTILVRIDRGDDP